MADELTYEQALELLDRSLRSLEEGDLSLEAALQAVEDARKYLLICEARLDEAKRKIEVRPAGEGDTAAADGDGDVVAPVEPAGDTESLFGP